MISSAFFFAFFSTLVVFFPLEAFDYCKQVTFMSFYRHESQSSAMPAPTIEFGNLCLSNAMGLLPNPTEVEKAFMVLKSSMQDPQGAEKYTE